MADSLEEIAKAAMQIILHAGDARNYMHQSFSALAKGNKLESDQYMDKANKEIIEAHKIQTGILQKESSGEILPNSYLFGHAQDTLMTVQSEIDMIQMLIKTIVFKERKGKNE